MISFKEFISNENLWGQIPVQGRKPSDGRGGYTLSQNTGNQGSSSPGINPLENKPPEAGPKMMRKKMRKN